MSLFSHPCLGAANCSIPVEAVATPLWTTITPPKTDLEVVYLAPNGWVGLNHIYAIHQGLRHRKRSFVPWMMPQVVTVFPFSHALEAPFNRAPLFYVDYSDTAPHLADLSPHEIHLVQLTRRAQDREMEATSGTSVFHFGAGFPSNGELPLSVHAISNHVFSIQPEKSLGDGEYLIVLGPVAADGFEFEINCLGEVRQLHVEPLPEK